MPHNQSLLLHVPILIVDTDETHNFILSRMLEWAGYSNVTVSTNATEAIALYERLNPDVVFVDVAMPGAGAPYLIGQLKARAGCTFLPVIAFSRNLTREARQMAVSQGASDILVKFGNSDEVLMRLGNFLKIRHLHRQLRDENLTLEETVRVRTSALDRAHCDLAERMAQAVEYRHDEFGNHATRVGDLSAELGKLLGLPSDEIDVLRLAAGFHDVGNVAVPDLVLLKPGPLTVEEREVMQLHTGVGSELLSRGHSALLRMAEVIARTHHERWDGGGYPSRLKRDEIPLPGRIVALADVFDALRGDRPYRGPKAFDVAVAEIDSLAGSHFDPTVVRAFKQVVAEPRRAA